MGSINIGRWILGGIVAGILIFVIEGLGSVLYMEEMRAAMEAHGLAMEVSGGVWIVSILASLLAGLVLVFFYAAALPRFGPGPRTALIVAVALFVGGYLLSLLGYYMLGLFPDRMLLQWGIIGVVEWTVATLVGGWIYREESYQ